MRKYFSIAFIVLLSLGLVCTRPFDIYADSISSSNIVGYNIVESTDSNLELELVLNRQFVGNYVVNVRFRKGTTDITRKYTFYFNGSTSVSSMNFGTSPIVLSDLTFTFVSSSGYFSDQTTQGFPFESNLFVLYMLNSGWQPSNLYNIQGQFEFPMFTINNFSYPIMSDYINIPNDDFYDKVFIFGLSDAGTIETDQQFKNWFLFKHYPDNADVTNDFEIISAETLFRTFYTYTSQVRIYKVVFRRKSINDNGAFRIWFYKENNNNDFLFIPIYYNYAHNSNVSLDFALRFKLSNPITDYVNGTPESVVSSDNLEDSNSDLYDVSNPMFTLEDSFNSNMNDSLDDIDTTFNFENGFGSKFLSSANFVKDEFDFLTQSNAFGSLLSFSLLLGLGLLIIGKIL